MKKSTNWRMWSSLGIFIVALVMIWPTFKWFSLPVIERDRAEASVQPETDNPYFRQLLTEMQEEGGEELIEHYRELFSKSEGTLKLGLDLQGGMYLAYTVHPVADLSVDEALDQAVEIIRNRIDEFGVSEPSITRQGEDRLVVLLPGVRDPARARAIVERQALLEFKVVAFPDEEHPSPEAAPVIREIDSFLAEQAPLETEILESDDVVLSSGEILAADQEDISSAAVPVEQLTEEATGEEIYTDLIADLADEAETDTVEMTTESLEVPELAVGGQFSELFGFASEDIAMTLRITPGDWIIEEGENLDQFNDIINIPEISRILVDHNLEFVFGKSSSTSEGVYVNVLLVPIDVTSGWDSQTGLEKPRYSLTGANLTDVRVRMGSGTSLDNNPYLILQFDSDGSRNWEQITSENIDERVSIILDGTIYSVARIRERIAGGGTRLTGGFSLEEARDLRLILKAGSLPARLEIAEEQTIGPSLGQKSIRRGIIAGILGLAIIGLFMIIYYGIGGVITNVALIFDLLILLAVLSFPGPLAGFGITGLGARLTLPGIAGIILTIGMAVDASVLIYERIREEKRAGKSLRNAVESGYDRAFVTILDSNITTLITALVLYRFGTGPIRGFAVTLSVGILASMFCSLVFGRMVLTFIARHRKTKGLSIGKLAVLRKSFFKVVSIRKKAYLISTVVILVGILGFAVNNGFKLAIDFTGGVETSVVRTQPVSVEEIKVQLEDAGLKSVQVQSLVDYQGDGAAYIVRTSTSDKEQVNLILADHHLIPMEEEQQGSSYIRQIGPRVGAELRDKATKAMIMAMIFIVFYIWWRFQFKWGIAAVAALAHDVLVTAGMLALLQVEISLTIIAALLTIVGYSINDTIVVFDRIREDVKLRKGKTFAETVNISINETLGRTVITSITTFTAVLMLFIFGGGTISDFALTLLIGIIAGTYSSIFVASPILVDWRSGKRKR